MHKNFIAVVFSIFCFTQTMWAQSKTAALKVNEIKTSDGSHATALGLQMASVKVMVDTSLRGPANPAVKSIVNGQMAYLSLDFSTVTGSNMLEITNGTHQFWVYDDQKKEVKIGNQILKKIGGSMESSIINYTVKIPFRLKTDQKKYSIRYRWESPDKKKWIEVLSTK